MRSLHIARQRSARERQGGSLERMRTRCTFGAVFSGACYIGTFVVDVVRSTPSDDSIVFGLEVGSAAAGVLCSLVAVMTWILTEHQGFAASVWALRDRADDQISHDALEVAVGRDNTVPISSARQRLRAR